MGHVGYNPTAAVLSAVGVRVLRVELVEVCITNMQKGVVPLCSSIIIGESLFFRGKYLLLELINTGVAEDVVTLV